MSKLYTNIKKFVNFIGIPFIILSILVVGLILLNNYKIININRSSYYFVSIAFLKVSYIKNNFKFIFFTFNILYFCTFAIIFNKKLRNKFFKFVKKIKKMKFRKNFKFIMNFIMYFFLFLVNTSPMALIASNFIDTAIIEIFIIYWWVWFFLLYFINIKYFSNINKIDCEYEKTTRKTRQKIIAIMYLILYFILNYFYIILEQFLFPINSVNFLTTNLKYFSTLFGRWGFILLVFTFVLLLQILTLLYFLKVMCIVNILTGRISTLFFGDCLYKKYDYDWSDIYFVKIFKKKFIDLETKDYTLFQKLFNPTKWFTFKLQVFSYFSDLWFYFVQNHNTNFIIFLYLLGLTILIIIGKFL